MNFMKIYENTPKGADFEYKSKKRVFREFNACKTVFDKLTYVKQLKKDSYDYVYNLDLDEVIKRLQNQIVINH